MKNFLRSLVPTSVQVPVKYMINKWRSQLEAELQLLPFLVKRGMLINLEHFDAKIDQKSDNLGVCQNYVNNFLFLSEERLTKRCYAELFSAWGAK